MIIKNIRYINFTNDIKYVTISEDNKQEYHTLRIQHYKPLNALLYLILPGSMKGVQEKL